MTDHIDQTIPIIETDAPARPPINVALLVPGIVCLLAVAVHGLLMLRMRGLSSEWGSAAVLTDVGLAMLGAVLIVRGLGREVSAAWRSAMLGIGLYLVYFAGMYVFNLHVPRLHPYIWAGVNIASTVAFLLVLVYAVRFIARLHLSARHEVLLMFGCLAVYLCLNATAIGMMSTLAGDPAWLKAWAHMTPASKHPYAAVLAPFLLVLTGAFFGQLIARVVRERTILLPVSLVAGLVDYWGVYWGVVGELSKMNPMLVTEVASAPTAAAQVPSEVISQLHQSLPPVLAVFGTIAPPDAIGIGDFVFLAFYLTCAYRLGFSVRRTMWGIFFGLLGTSILFAMNGQEVFGYLISIEYLPALPFICGGMLLANIPLWRLTKQEWAMTAVPVALMLGLISFSAFRVQQDAPREVRRVGTPKADTAQQAIDWALSRLTTGTAEQDRKRAKEMGVAMPKPLVGHAQVEVRVVQFTYRLAAKGPTAQSWQMYAMGTAQPPRRETTWEYLLQAQPTPKEPGFWYVEVLGNRPLREDGDLYGFSRVIPIDVLRKARAGGPVPKEAFALQERIGALCRDIPPGTGEQPTHARLCLLGDGAVLESDDKAFHKQYPQGKPVPYDGAATGN